MSDLPITSEHVEAEETDQVADFVQLHQITTKFWKVDVRPDVAEEEQMLWATQDPDYPPEHYRCSIICGSRQVELYQTVGADYPDDDEDADNSDLYRDARELLLSPEFLIESAALKSNSIDEAKNLDEWIANAYCETTTPSATYNQFVNIRAGLIDLLGEDRYRTLVRLAIDAELERDEESEDEA